MLLTIDLPQEYEPQINALAQEAGQNNSDYIKSLLMGIVEQKKSPNAETRQAMQELASGKGHRFTSLDDALEWLNAD